jgi:hypothetical protein
MVPSVFQLTPDNSNPVTAPTQLGVSVTASGSGSSRSVKGAHRG